MLTNECEGAREVAKHHQAGASGAWCHGGYGRQQFADGRQVSHGGAVACPSHLQTDQQTHLQPGCI